MMPYPRGDVDDFYHEEKDSASENGLNGLKNRLLTAVPTKVGSFYVHDSATPLESNHWIQNPGASFG